MNIAITIPKAVEWADYEKELAAAANFSHILNFKVNSLPVKTGVGSRCYVIHRGVVMGYHQHLALRSEGTGSFRCTTTGVTWTGRFIQRTGPFTRMKHRVLMTGFQGFRYVHIEDAPDQAPE